MVGEDSLGGGQTVGVLVEQDITLILDEFALLEDAVHLAPATWPSLELDTGLSKASAERISSFPSADASNKYRYGKEMIVDLRMVVRDVAVDVVKNVSLGNAMSGRSTNPAHKAAEAAEKIAVKGRQSTTREGELGCTVVGKERVGVLKECDEDKPMVYPSGILVTFQI